MDLNFTPEELAFREEARRFFRTEVPDAIRRKVDAGQKLGKDDIVTAQRILNARGWAVPNWPANGAGRTGRRCSSICGRTRCSRPACRSRCRSTPAWSGP